MTDSSEPESFAIVTRDGLWLHGELTESRLSHGLARQHGQRIDASDARDEELACACDAAFEDAMPVVETLRAVQLRLRVRALREDSVESVETTVTIAIGGVSVVTTPAEAMADCELLRELVGLKPRIPFKSLPMVWRNGSGAVLLHEAVGHASEQAGPAVRWPSWLSVEAPLRLRRETFRDVPLLRMAHLVAAQNGAPFDMPPEHIEVHLIDGGAYDPLTDIVSIDVAISSAGPFTIRRTRTEIAASLAGATGNPVRYPGVICSREGQQLFVASYAPLLITGPLA